METLTDRMARKLRELMDATPSLDTQTKVSRATGCSQSTVQRILKREQSVTLAMLEDIAAAFGVKPTQHILLDTDEALLLQQFQVLPKESRDKVIGYIAISAQALPPTTQAPVLSFKNYAAVPWSLDAAVAKASNRPITPTQPETATSASDAPRKKHRRHAP